MNDKDILKHLALELLIFCVKGTLAMAAFLGGICCVGWIGEVLSGLLSFETLFVTFLALVFYLIVRR